MTDRGYVWFAFGEKYIEASERLAASIKKHNRYNKICVITDNHWLQLPNAIKNVDTVELFEGETKGKFEKEWQVFKFSPFTHSIKLEADMIFTGNTDWWWNYLEQWDMVHSYNCRNYKDDIVKTTKIAGVIATNTTINREGLTSENKAETGGLSGKPLYDNSNIILKKMYELTNGQIPLIGVGGISSGRDCYDKIKSGASLVQLYTALVYSGPNLINSMKSELIDLIKTDGYKNVSDVIGKSV